MRAQNCLETWLPANKVIIVCGIDLRQICEEEISVFQTDLQHMSPKSGLETWLTANEEIL